MTRLLIHGGSVFDSIGGTVAAADVVVEGDRIVAGATGRTEFNRLFTSYLWVSDERRGQGLGSECLTRLEAAARARGCTDAVLETLSDSNQALYERLGYETIVTLVAWVGGFNRHFMRKSL